MQTFTRTTGEVPGVHCSLVRQANPRWIHALVVILCFLQEVSSQDFSCDVSADSCPTKNNGICDSSFGDSPQPGCENGDCEDCDAITCAQLNYDCRGCLNATGCFWCEVSATCHNSDTYNFPSKDSCTSSALGTNASYITNATGSCTASTNMFNDPLFRANEWVYNMINVKPVWRKSIFGDGVKIRINDSGVRSDHAEFMGRFDLNASCEQSAPLDDDGPESGHGTSVASIVAANMDNNECAVGIAPLSSISSCNIFANADPAANIFATSTENPTSFLAQKLDQMDISQNSFGLPACEAVKIEIRQVRNDTNCPFQQGNLSEVPPCDACDFSGTITEQPECAAAITSHCQQYFEQDDAGCSTFLSLLTDGCNYNKLSQAIIDDLTKGIEEGRDGKGIIFVFAAGNSYFLGDDVNFSEVTNSRYTITVGAVGKDGLHASYSSPGAALFVSAPGGDQENLSNHVVASRQGGCQDGGVGTSSASPVVSGVIALMLEANPVLTWRDIQGIIASTSTPVTSDPDDTTVFTNAGGYFHSNLYGFGIINADAAVNASQKWEPYGEELQIVVPSGAINTSLTDNDSVTLSASVDSSAGNSSFIIESVEISLDLLHFSRGDLEITLISPAGTRSVLHPGNRPENTIPDDQETWNLMTVRNWGESPTGEWQLILNDTSPGDLAACSDAPFYALTTTDALTCEVAVEKGYCVNGQIEESVVEVFSAITDNELSIIDACCDCGGGLNTTSFEDALNQWTLVLFGREATGVNSSTAPTQLPSTSLLPTRTPTQSPAPTRQREESAEESETGWTTSRITTIAATVVALVMSCCCVWCALRSPTSKVSQYSGNLAFRKPLSDVV